jgi:hypothetical protein
MQGHLEKCFSDREVCERNTFRYPRFRKWILRLPKIRRVTEYLSFQFQSDLNIKETAATTRENYSLSKPYLENEIITLKNDIFLKTLAVQESFWKLVPRNKAPNLRRCSEIAHSCFGSTYLCEAEAE